MLEALGDSRPQVGLTRNLDQPNRLPTGVSLSTTSRADPTGDKCEAHRGHT